MVCQAYLAALLSAGQVEAAGIPIEGQMVTVWPVAADVVEGLNLFRSAERGLACELAVDNYDLLTGLAALGHAQLVTSQNLDRGRGPYLLAWAPSSAKGTSDTFVLLMDLSNVDNQESFDQRFQEWREHIVDNPSLWGQGRGWVKNQLMALRDILDGNGGAIVTILGG